MFPFTVTELDVIVTSSTENVNVTVREFTLSTLIFKGTDMNPLLSEVLNSSKSFLRLTTISSS